jgi:hypothetical protein
MVEQVRRLKALFKHWKVNPDKDDGDDNSYGEYWEFIESNELEA